MTISTGSSMPVPGGGVSGLASRPARMRSVTALFARRIVPGVGRSDHAVNALAMICSAVGGVSVFSTVTLSPVDSRSGTGIRPNQPPNTGHRR